MVGDAEATAGNDQAIERFSEDLVDSVLTYAPVAAGTDLNPISEISILKCSNVKWTSTAIGEGYSEVRVRLFVGYGGEVSYPDLVKAVAAVQEQVLASANSSAPASLTTPDPDGWSVDVELSAFIPDPEYVVEAAASTKPDTLILGLETYASYAVVAAASVGGLLFLVAVVALYRCRTRELVYYVSDAENEGYKHGDFSSGNVWGTGFPPWDDDEELDIFQTSMLSGRGTHTPGECACELCVQSPPGSPRRARVREVVLQRQSMTASFGFSLGSSNVDAGGLNQHVVTEVKPGGSADGRLERGNAVHTINGTNVSALAHDAVTSMIVSSDLSISLGIDDLEVEIEHATPPSHPSDAGEGMANEGAGLVHVTITRDATAGGGFGFSLGSESVRADGTTPHVIVNVFPGSPACGLLDVGDVVRVINGENVAGLSHHDTITKVQQSDTNIALGVYQTGANISFVPEDLHPTYTTGEPVSPSPSSPLPAMPSSPDIAQAAPAMSRRTSSTSIMDRRAELAGATPAAANVIKEDSAEAGVDAASDSGSDSDAPPPPPTTAPSNFSPPVSPAFVAATLPLSANSSPEQRRTKLKEKLARRRAEAEDINYFPGTSPAVAPVSPRKSAIKERIAQRMKAKQLAVGHRERSSSVEVEGGDEYGGVLGSPGSVGSSLPPSPQKAVAEARWASPGSMASLPPSPVKVVTKPKSSYSPRATELRSKSDGASPAKERPASLEAAAPGLLPSSEPARAPPPPPPPVRTAAEAEEWRTSRHVDAGTAVNAEADVVANGDFIAVGGRMKMTTDLRHVNSDRPSMQWSASGLDSNLQAKVDAADAARRARSKLEAGADSCRMLPETPALEEQYNLQWQRLADMQVTVSRAPGSPLGLAFQGGYIEGRATPPALRVTNVKEGSACSGLLKINDLIRSINGSLVDRLTHEQCVALMVESPGDLHFSIKRNNLQSGGGGTAEAAASGMLPPSSEPERAPPPPPPPAARKPSTSSDFSHGFEVPTFSSDDEADGNDVAPRRSRKMSRFQGGGFLEDSYTDDVMEEGIQHPTKRSGNVDYDHQRAEDRGRSNTLARDEI